MTLQSIFSKSNKIDLLSNMGKLMYSQSLGQQNTSIDLSQYPAGIYILKITSDNFTRSYKIMKE